MQPTSAQLQMRNAGILSIQQKNNIEMLNLTMQLIKHESQRMDFEFENEHPDLVFKPVIYTTADFDRQEETYEESSQIDPFEENSTNQDSSQSIQEPPRIPKDIGFSMKQVQREMRRRIIRRQSQDSAMLEQSDSNTPGRRGKKGQAVKPSYPTKNFLPNFKGPHLDWLKSWFGQDYIAKNQFITKLEIKNGISLSDYENLYKIKEFDEAFKEMFRSRYLYREMELSRSDYETKLIHHRKIPVFRRAFITKKFKGIN